MSILLPLEPPKAAYRVTIERENGMTADVVSVAPDPAAALAEAVRRYCADHHEAVFEKLRVYVTPLERDNP